MGYTFIVGNAVPKFGKEDFPYLYASWWCEGMSSPDAPVFPNDEMTGNSNTRSPSYSVWANFCRETGIYHLFYDERDRLHCGHPGCMGITKEFADELMLALEMYKAKATLPPGFEAEWGYDGPPNYDYSLARLIWLQWWVNWAITNCETPAISNY